MLLSFPGRADVCIDGKKEGAEAALTGPLHGPPRVPAVSPHVQLEPKWGVGLSGDLFHGYRREGGDSVRDAGVPRGASYSAFTFVVEKPGRSDWREHDRQGDLLTEDSCAGVDRGDPARLLRQKLDHVQGCPVAVQGVLSLSTGVEVGARPERQARPGDACDIVDAVTTGQHAGTIGRWRSLDPEEAYRLGELHGYLLPPVCHSNNWIWHPPARVPGPPGHGYPKPPAVRAAKDDHIGRGRRDLSNINICRYGCVLDKVLAIGPKLPAVIASPSPQTTGPGYGIFCVAPSEDLSEMEIMRQKDPQGDR